MLEEKELQRAVSDIKDLEHYAVQRVSQLEPASALADKAICMAIGDFYKGQGQWVEAIKWYEHVSSQISPSYPSAYTNQALCSYYSLGTSEMVRICDESLGKIDFSGQIYTTKEILNYLKVFCLALSKVDRGQTLHAVHIIMSSLLQGCELEYKSQSELLYQCTALSKLKTCRPNPIPSDSRQKLISAVEQYACLSHGHLMITRPGNIEIVACLNENYTWHLGNNAGIYEHRASNFLPNNFNRYREEYIEAMKQSDMIMIANFFDNYAGPALDYYGIREKAINCPSDVDTFCRVLETLLESKKVLCISSFAYSMLKQSALLNHIHGNKYNFKVDNLRFYGCTQSIAFSNPLPWHVSLEEMKEDLSLLDFDIALVSAGGYGHLLALHLANSNKSSIYVGGILQAVFGISGKRFKDISDAKNNHFWVKPSPDEIPDGYKNVEGGCYW
jgi:hypothetical protein